MPLVAIAVLPFVLASVVVVAVRSAARERERRRVRGTRLPRTDGAASDAGAGRLRSWGASRARITRSRTNVGGTRLTMRR